MHYGLYVAFIPAILGALWGSSRQLATGPVAIISLMTAAALTPLAVPFSENYVTASLAIHHFTKKGDHATAAQLREHLQARGLTQVGRRPPICKTGCQLKRILEGLGVVASKTCNCDEFAAQLDSLHPREIRDQHSEIGKRLA